MIAEEGSKLSCIAPALVQMLALTLDLDQVSQLVPLQELPRYKSTSRDSPRLPQS